MKLEVYKRQDGLWAWHLLAENGQVVATDGGQGYEHRLECVEMAEKATAYSWDPPEDAA